MLVYLVFDLHFVFNFITLTYWLIWGVVLGLVFCRLTVWFGLFWVLFAICGLCFVCLFLGRVGIILPCVVFAVALGFQLCDLLPGDWVSV